MAEDTPPPNEPVLPTPPGGTPPENHSPRAIEEEVRSSFLDYSMSVIISRALPDVRDGLKPVHQRILYAMQQEGLIPTRAYSKSAGVVGEQNDGFLGFVQGEGDPAVQAAVAEINAGRAQLYRQAAAKNGVTPEAAGAAAYASVVQLKLRPGDYYQTPEGAWVQK